MLLKHGTIEKNLYVFVSLDDDNYRCGIVNREVDWKGPSVGIFAKFRKYFPRLVSQFSMLLDMGFTFYYYLPLDSFIVLKDVTQDTYQKELDYTLGQGKLDPKKHFIVNKYTNIANIQEFLDGVNAL